MNIFGFILYVFRNIGFKKKFLARIEGGSCIVRDVERNKSPILLVFWPVFGVALRGTDNEYAPRNAS